MSKKENRIAVRQAAEKAVIRDEQNRRIQQAATAPVKEVLKDLHTALCGLDEGKRSPEPQSIWEQSSYP